MNQVFIQSIKTALKKAKSKGLYFKELTSVCNVKPKQLREFRDCIRFLEAKGIIIDRNIKLYHTDYVKLSVATVTRINKTYGFVKLKEDESEMFIPGKFFMGAMPGDTVLVTPIQSRGSSPEGEIVRILNECDSEFTGTLSREGDSYSISPDIMARFPMPISRRHIKDARAGDKVLCRILSRGRSHQEHSIAIVTSYGDAQTAANCAMALLDANGIECDFPPQVKAEAMLIGRSGINPRDYDNREDLRQDIIFTIDGADTKDIDDAISLTRHENGYTLGVHIADVSHYVKPHSKLDEDAFKRGTSIYFADRVIPMLPPELSNGICSLNPQEDRLAFSCIMQISHDGMLLDYRFKKSVINSRVKGVYKEINQILGKTEDNDIKQKYSGLYDTIFLMKELADILTANKRERGAPDIDTPESYVVLNEQGVTVDILPRSRGASEVMIEEFMLMANEAAASAATKAQVPFIYRVHEPPSEDKINSLHTALTALGIPCQTVKLGLPAKVLSGLIRQSEGTDIYPIINSLVLRSMSKAKYHEVPIGHYGLALENYAQFTSPIRRYPDLSIHRVLTDLAMNTPKDKITKKFEKFVVHSARQSTETELAAMRLERDCDDIYKAEYMKSHIGEEFDGVISSVASHGIYIILQNTVEGLVRLDDMPAGQYDLDEMISYKNMTTGTSYRVGDHMRVQCTNADVSAGNVDFIPVLE